MEWRVVELWHGIGLSELRGLRAAYSNLGSFESSPEWMKIPDFGQASTPRPGPKIQNLVQPYHLGTQKKLAKSNRCRKNVHTD